MQVVENSKSILSHFSDFVIKCKQNYDMRQDFKVYKGQESMIERQEI